jgi:tetraacyldisaccharide 4'-kinase
MSTRSAVRRLLLPLTPVYRLALAVRELKLRRGWEQVDRLRFPVISVGNLSTGGAGKTPFAIALARALAARGLPVDILSRGYGRRSFAPARVRPDGTPEEFGDEPLLMAREAGAPVYVARRRYEAGLLAEADPRPDNRSSVHIPHIHILDDAFQHRQLHRDVDILLLNREDWQDRLLPSGNLREPLRAAKRAGVIAIPCDDPGLERELRVWGWHGPVWRLRRHMEAPRVEGAVLAFCGIARPEQFFAGLEAAGVRLAARIAFGDHHRYALRDMERLQTMARTSGATALVTTRKDEIRLHAIAGGSAPARPILTAGLTVEIEDESSVLDWLTARITEASPPNHSL